MNLKMYCLMQYNTMKFKKKNVMVVNSQLKQVCDAGVVIWYADNEISKGKKTCFSIIVQVSLWNS